MNASSASWYSSETGDGRGTYTFLSGFKVARHELERPRRGVHEESANRFRHLMESES